MSLTINSNSLLFENADWDFTTIQRINDAVEQIALKELGLNVYANQIEVISTEQMLDAYSSIGMPLFYKHWSFGKHFARNEAMYRAGMQGLAYEIVINSNPCISYIMEENTATMQTLVIAHAAYGHNHFFKNNYVFKQWTDAGDWNEKRTATYVDGVLTLNNTVNLLDGTRGPYKVLYAVRANGTEYLVSEVNAKKLTDVNQLKRGFAYTRVLPKVRLRNPLRQIAQ